MSSAKVKHMSILHIFYIYFTYIVFEIHTEFRYIMDKWFEYTEEYSMLSIGNLFPLVCNQTHKPIYFNLAYTNLSISNQT